MEAPRMKDLRFKLDAGFALDIDENAKVTFSTGKHKFSFLSEASDILEIDWTSGNPAIVFPFIGIYAHNKNERFWVTIGKRRSALCLMHSANRAMLIYDLEANLEKIYSQLKNAFEFYCPTFGHTYKPNKNPTFKPNQLVYVTAGYYACVVQEENERLVIYGSAPGAEHNKKMLVKLRNRTSIKQIPRYIPLELHSWITLDTVDGAVCRGSTTRLIDPQTATCYERIDANKFKDAFPSFETVILIP